MTPSARIRLCNKLVALPWEHQPQVQYNHDGNRRVNGYIIHHPQGRASIIDRHGEILAKYDHLITDEDVLDERLRFLKSSSRL